MATGNFQSALCTDSFAVSVGTAAVALSTAANGLLIHSFTIQAATANSGTIYIGGPDVSSSNGVALAAGDALSFDLLKPVRMETEMYDLSKVYVAASVASQAVRVLTIIRVENQ